MRETLDPLLDTLIPPRPEADLPGPSGLGVTEFVEGRLGDAAPLVAGGLAALEAAARERGAEAFGALDADARRALVEAVAPAHPGLVECLVFHGYAGYYQHPRVAEVLGLEPRPPFPEGYPLEAGDLGGLEAVRAGPRRYREV